MLHSACCSPTAAELDDTAVNEDKGEGEARQSPSDGTAQSLEDAGGSSSDGVDDEYVANDDRDGSDARDAADSDDSEFTGRRADDDSLEVWRHHGGGVKRRRRMATLPAQRPAVASRLASLPTVFSCKQCAFMCTDAAALATHNDNHARGVPMFPCAVCHRVYGTKNSLYSHKRDCKGPKGFMSATKRCKLP